MENIKYYKDSEELGRHLRHLRIASGLKSRELAELSGIGQSTISFWERGDTGNLDHGKAVATLEKFEKAFGVLFVKGEEPSEDEPVKKNEESTNTSVDALFKDRRIIFVKCEEGVSGRSSKDITLLVFTSIENALNRIHQCWMNICGEVGSTWVDFKQDSLAKLTGSTLSDNEYLFVNVRNKEYFKYTVYEAEIGEDGCGVLSDPALFEKGGEAC